MNNASVAAFICSAIQLAGATPDHVGFGQTTVEVQGARRHNKFAPLHSLGVVLAALCSHGAEPLNALAKFHELHDELDFV